MKDQIVTGVRGQDTRQDLLKIQGFNLQKGTDTCRAAEQSQAMKTEFAHVMSYIKKIKAMNSNLKSAINSNKSNFCRKISMDKSYLCHASKIKLTIIFS